MEEGPGLCPGALFLIAIHYRHPFEGIHMSQVTMVREWDADQFHAKVLELEQKGWKARRETYKILAEMNPETGFVSHVHSIELSME